MTTLDLRHYAESPVALDRTRKYMQADPVVPDKPRGFWVSIAGEDDWPTFCRSEKFGLDRLVAEHTVVLAADAAVLHLQTAGELEAFHAEYSVAQTAAFPLTAERYRPIDWHAVARAYEGIIIAPYQWSMRLDGPFWYYGWDVASGCIWDLGAIDSVTVLANAEAVHA